MRFLDYVKDNSPSILAGAGVLGVVGTAVMASKATPKALDILEKKEEYKQEWYGAPLTRFEKVLAVFPVYIPTILMGAATAGCILGSNHINQQRQATLISAYACLDATYKEYQNKVKEIFGEKAEQQVREELKKDIYLDKKYGDVCEKRLIYDEFSDRYFEMSIYEFQKAVYDANRVYNHLGDMSLNQFYEFLNLEPTELGATLGWSAHKDWECLGFSWLNVSVEKMDTPDNLEVLALQFGIDPCNDWQNWSWE